MVAKKPTTVVLVVPAKSVSATADRARPMRILQERSVNADIQKDFNPVPFGIIPD
jgi:hypothetical protein